jgi:uncharacterized membrane protein YeaQ/YmgE (transglycosylase-associated protein family)
VAERCELDNLLGEGCTMESGLISWLISLISGAVGGNAAGAVAKENNLGATMNTVLGALGGAAGGQLLPLLITGLQGTGLLGNVGPSAILGLLLPLIVSFLKKKSV